MKKQFVKAQARKPIRPSGDKRGNRTAVTRVTAPKAGAKAQRNWREPAKTPPAKPLALSRPLLADTDQQRHYDGAMQLFKTHKFEQANMLFQKAMLGPNRSLAHHAQMHSQVCQKRMRPPEVNLQTADDHYHYAVTLMNARRLQEAAEHLEKALRMAPHAGHLHYALAATRALQGNPQGAYERLKTAIDLDPRNRILARGDADFAAILGYPPVASLLRVDRGFSPRAPE